MARLPDDSRPLVGAFWMLITGILFVAVTGVVKHVGQSLPAQQAAFMRFALGLVFLLPLLPALRAARFTRGDLRLYALRGVVHTIGVLCWFFAMARITVAEVTAMNYLAPIYVTIGAGLFLGERLAFRRIAAVVVAFLGALIILRPGLREVSPGHIAMLGTALAMGASYLIGKKTSDTHDPAVVVWMLSIAVTVLLAPLAAAVWVAPTWAQVGWMALVAGLATIAHYTMTLAFRAAPVTITQPVTFVQLVWASLLGWLVFGEAIDPFVALGGTVIIAAVSFVTWREAQIHRREITPTTPATKV